eukprot:TRINITY_DN1615_c0_g1_i1.p1 TRINITY_DN1615_c0_g1~~TRINITY_DN1615_c0_g1_i1.p1  ORF type:complete len:277 (+),score=115.50 TRINITY_DN1615_c0_g1_i1:34-864(+)
MCDAAIAECEGKLAKYKQLYTGEGTPTNPAACKQLLHELKVLFTTFPTFLNPSADSATRIKEISLVREAMENSVLLAAATKNTDDFAQNFEILRVYYTDFKDEPKSERRLLILGLHLLRLLAMNETRAYHMELERIAVEDHDNMYIKDVVQLERYIMEGSYHKMLQARSKVPSAHYVPLMEMLLVTVRREVFKCATHAYEELSVEGARKLLMFDNTDDLRAFVEAEKERRGDEVMGWVLEGDKYKFVHNEDQDDRLPFATVISNNLGYANELQRIV